MQWPCLAPGCRPMNLCADDWLHAFVCSGLGYTIVRPGPLVEEAGGYKALVFDQVRSCEMGSGMMVGRFADTVADVHTRDVCTQVGGLLRQVVVRVAGPRMAQGSCCRHQAKVQSPPLQCHLPGPVHAAAHCRRATASPRASRALTWRTCASRRCTTRRPATRRLRWAG